jgi:hypothetical protein
MRTRVTGDDAPYGEHFIVWGACAPNDELEDELFMRMELMRSFDQRMVSQRMTSLKRELNDLRKQRRTNV